MAKEAGQKGSGNPTITTARRAIGITKMYLAITVFLTFIALFVWNSATYSSIASNSTNSSTNGTHHGALSALSGNSLASNSMGSAEASLSGVPIISVPLDVVPALMLVTPVVLLFVYDKNNGVLEYLLSLGMTQRDIYMRYLKAALLLTAVYAVIFFFLNVTVSYEIFGPAMMILLPMMLLTPLLDLCVASLLVIFMMAFSSLQQTRAGSNQPLGIIVGYACTIPAYLPAALPFAVAIYAEAGVAAALAVIAVFSMFSAGKLIKREKLLP